MLVVTHDVASALVVDRTLAMRASWLSASNRLTNFAIMRALGMAPRQVAAVLLWEQGFVYILAWLLPSPYLTLLDRVPSTIPMTRPPSRR